MILRNWIFYLLLALAFVVVGVTQSWSVALATLNLSLISAVMAIGVNIQWGFGGLLNAGIVGFVALGGVTAIVIAHPPVPGVMEAGGGQALAGVLKLAVFAAIAYAVRKFVGKTAAIAATVVLVAIAFIWVLPDLSAGIKGIESHNPSAAGFLGGLGLPILIAWPIAGAVAAFAAMLIGRVALGLRADYLAIATLGIAEIIVFSIKNEDWLTRGVKNVTGLPSPIPSITQLNEYSWVASIAEWVNRAELSALTGEARDAALSVMVAETSTILVKIGFAGLFLLVLILFAHLSSSALNSPWGRKVRAIRDNELSASAMGKDVRRQHMQLLILGSAVVGVAGAMLVTYEGQFTPISYQPLRFTFLILVMVIVGGSGSNAGSIFGSFLIWLVWIQSEAIGFWLVNTATAWMPEGSELREHLLRQSQYWRFLIMGMILISVLRFNPKGLIPEQPGKVASTKN